MKQNLFFISFLLLTLSLSAQTLLYNNNQTLFLNDNAVMIVKNGDIDNNQGIIENKGKLIIEGSFINNDETVGGINSGEFQVKKDWVNNGNFIEKQSTVSLNGNIQTITGSQITNFYNLFLENNGIKTQTIDLNVSNILKLNSSQLASGNNKTTVTNTAPNAIEFIEDAGFVSSEGDGRLVRNTNSSVDYIFPVGEINSGLKYRPILIKPTTTNENQYEVRLVYDNAGTEGYPLTDQNGSLQNLNDKFFHYINQSEGNEETVLEIHYKPQEDGSWNEIARWKDSEWSSEGNITLSEGDNFTVNSKSNWISNNDEPYVLANLKEGTLYAIPNAFAPNGDQEINKVFGVLNQNGLVELEHMQIFNRWGTKIFDSLKDNSETWDGMHDGILQPTGNYTYLINLKDLQGESLAPISGNFLLIW